VTLAWRLWSLVAGGGWRGAASCLGWRGMVAWGYEMKRGEKKGPKSLFFPFKPKSHPIKKGTLMP
jgi:hypothetical protein